MAILLRNGMQPLVSHACMAFVAALRLQNPTNGGDHTAADNMRAAGSQSAQLSWELDRVASRPEWRAGWSEEGPGHEFKAVQRSAPQTGPRRQARRSRYKVVPRPRISETLIGSECVPVVSPGRLLSKLGSMVACRDCLTGWG